MCFPGSLSLKSCDVRHQYPSEATSWESQPKLRMGVFFLRSLSGSISPENPIPPPDKRKARCMWVSRLPTRLLRAHTPDRLYSERAFPLPDIPERRSLSCPRCACIDVRHAQKASRKWTLEMDVALVQYINRLCRHLAITPARLHPHEVYLDPADATDPRMACLSSMWPLGVTPTML